MAEAKTLQEATAEVKKPEVKAEQPKTKGPIAYRCITKCFYKSRIYNVGDKVLFDPGLSVPEHFVKES